MDLKDSMVKNIILSARDYYMKAIPFDMKFDLETDDKMYCSEFVAKSINKSISPRQVIPKSSINHFSFIGIDDITGMPFIKNIFSKKYINQ